MNHRDTGAQSITEYHRELTLCRSVSPCLRGLNCIYIHLLKQPVNFPRISIFIKSRIIFMQKLLTINKSKYKTNALR